MGDDEGGRGRWGGAGERVPPPRGAPPPPASGSSDMFARGGRPTTPARVLERGFSTFSFIGPRPKSQQLVHLLTFQRVRRDRAARAEGFNGTAPRGEVFRKAIRRECLAVEREEGAPG